MEIRGAPSLSDIFDQYITLKWRQGKVSGIWERKAKFVLHQTPKRSFGAPVSDVKFLDQKRSVGAPLIVTLRFWTKGSQLGPPVSSGGRLTSLEASLVRCFAFYKALGALFCKNNVQNIASLSKKCNVFTRCFRLYKVNPETKIDKQGKLSVKMLDQGDLTFKWRNGYICVPSRQYVSSCVSVTYVLVWKCKQLVNL